MDLFAEWSGLVRALSYKRDLQEPPVVVMEAEHSRPATFQLTPNREGAPPRRRKASL
jgi:hypothetical protein